MPDLFRTLRPRATMIAGLLAACAESATPAPIPDGLILQPERIRIAPVKNGQVVVAGEAGAAAPPAVRVTLVVEATAAGRQVAHLGHITASASVPLEPDGSFGPVTLSGIPILDPVLAGYALEMQAWSATGEPGPFLVRTLQAPAAP